MRRNKKRPTDPVLAQNATDALTRPNCGNCRCSIPTDDPSRVVCVPYCDYRDPTRGGDCSRYARKPAPTPYTSAFLPRK